MLATWVPLCDYWGPPRGSVLLLSGVSHHLDEFSEGTFVLLKLTDVIGWQMEGSLSLTESGLTVMAGIQGL